MDYDFIIIGGSAAGTAATIYATRRGLRVLVIASNLGGEVATSGEIENWPGIIHTDGITLAGQFRKHMEAYKPTILEGVKVKSFQKQGEGKFVVMTDDEKEYRGKSVLVATGIHPRELGVPGEKEYRVKGISYCTVCDGPLFSGKKVATIGGGNSALESALMLADIAEHVTVINKNAQFKGETVLIDGLAKKPNITVVYEAMTKDFFGEPGGFLKGLHYTDKAGETHELAVDGAFVHIGSLPNSGFVDSEVTKDQFGQIVVGMDGSTSMPGLFAAGDVTNVPHKQIIIAAGMGAAAALSAVQYINRLK
ncbi:MAG TPA: FAD-dependent oxidoreductase [Candidatus Paceibacterota bacterium]|nr:FAD-dependent oxidoreductase [Candidatus Paceibacterota bacterium]